MISVFLPIRRGSKRVKNKNIKKIRRYNLGLTEIKIKQLMKLRKKLDAKYKLEFIVATDCPKVQRFCKKFKWIKTFKRSKNNSGDYSLQKIINLAPKICGGKYILWTHVTSPLFNSKCYMDFIRNYFRMKSDRSAFSADIIKKFLYQKDNKWISHNYTKTKWPRSQDLKITYAVNSAAFIALRKTYLKHMDRLCKNPIPIISIKNSGFDIDEISDFEYLKKVKINL